MITLNHSRKFLGLTGSTRRLLFEPASDGFDEDDPGQKAADRPYLEESTFNTNMLLILAALLCFLICAMGLHSIVRCVLRWTRWQAALFVPAEDMEAVRVGNTGMNRKALRALPTAVYGGGGRGRKLPCSTDCPICLAEFVEGEKVRVLPKCNHAFHMRCIDTWLASHSSCPTCRQNLLQLSHSNNKNDNEVNLNMSTSAHSEPPPVEEALQ